MKQYLLMFILCISLSEFTNSDRILDNTNKKVKAFYSYGFQFDYTTSIHVQSKGFTTIPKYTKRVFTNDMDYLEVTYRIPFTGNQVTNSRSRLTVMFDQTVVTTFAKYNTHPWELNDVVLTGRVYNVKRGNHIVKILGAVDRGILNVPHFNPGLIENTLDPKINGNLYLFGIMKKNYGKGKEQIKIDR